MSSVKRKSLFIESSKQRYCCLITQCPSEFLIIHRVKSDAFLLTWNRDILRVLFDADERTCFNVIVTTVLDKVFYCLPGKGAFLHLIKDNDRLPLFQYYVIQGLQLKKDIILVHQIIE